jgi:type I restriction enzyme S subunit
VAEFDGICSAHAMVLRAKPKTVDPKFLPFLMQSDLFMQRAIDISVGSLSPTINWKTLRIQQFPLPPKDEQRRIAEILWAADETLQRHLAVRDAAELLTESLAAEFLRLEWPCVPCDQLFTERPRNGLSPNCNAEERGYPTLALGAVREGRIIAEGNIKYAEISESDLERFRLRRGDVLVVRGNGNRHLCGRCGVVDLPPENCFYPDLLIRLSFDAERIDPEFAALQWNTREVHARLLQRAKSTNGIWKINGKDIRQHRLATPPMKEQKEFMKRLAPAKDAVERVGDTVRCIEQLKHRLVNELVRGPNHVH